MVIERGTVKKLLLHAGRVLVLLLLPVTIISCGGGGGVGDEAVGQATHADLSISLQQILVPLAPPGVLVTGIDVTVHLPSGSTYLGVDPVNNGTVQGIAYDALNHSVTFLVTGPSGISIGSIAKVRCSMSIPLTASAFTSANNGNPITDFTATGEVPPGTTHDITAQLLPQMSVSLY